MNKLLFIILSFFYVFVNNIFLYKYGYRDLGNNIFIVNVLYAIFLCVLLWKKDAIYSLLKRFNVKNIYFTLTAFFVVLSLIITLVIDGNSLNLDRWSAMTVAIESIIKNEYPYTATDHLNGRTSNFPGLILIGVPFYFMGNVGLLQVFSLAFLCYTLYVTVKLKNALYYLVLFTSSIAFWYEVASLSDFMSNMILVFCFIMLWNNKHDKFKYRNPIILAIILSILILTRGIVFVPLVVYFFADFFKSKFKTQVVFTLAFISTCAFLIYMTLKDCPDKATLLKFNPLILQTSFTPLWVNITMIILPIIVSFFVRKTNQFIIATIIISLLIINYYFFNYIFWYGFQESIHGSKIDVVYLSYILPFLCYYFVNNKTNSLSN